MKILEKMSDELNETFRDDLRSAVQDEFDIAISTDWNIMSMRLSSSREDGKKLTLKQFRFISAFEKGYLAARARVDARAYS